MHPLGSDGVTPVGFEPTQLALVELGSTPLDHSGKVSSHKCSSCSIKINHEIGVCVQR